LPRGLLFVFDFLLHMLQTTARAHGGHGMLQKADSPSSDFDDDFRVLNPLDCLQTSGDASVSAFPDNDNLFQWIGTIRGPAATVSTSCLTVKLCLFPSSLFLSVVVRL
jgi:hypothetical protein